MMPFDVFAFINWTSFLVSYLIGWSIGEVIRTYVKMLMELKNIRKAVKSVEMELSVIKQQLKK